MSNKFETKVVIRAVLIAVIPIIISFGIFLHDKIDSIDTRIKDNLCNAAFVVSTNPVIVDKLSKKENDLTIQSITMKYVKNLKDVDIIVVADMDGRKYSHDDLKQIGDIFVGADKKEVLKSGKSYYSITQGSIGVTLRRFEPIYLNGSQIGFVMVGKYYNDVKFLTRATEISYFSLFILVFLATLILSKYFSRGIKKSMLSMEPEEIAKLYKEKKIIIDTISDGIIALDSNNQVVEINDNCVRLFQDFSLEKVLNKLNPFLESGKFIEMKEMRINNKKLFITIKPIYDSNLYLGAVITLTDKEGINKIAKEITGVDEVVKDLRANNHEFKNKLHVILGLINIGQYDEARKYIMQIQQVQENNFQKYSFIDDFYIRAMIISRELMAKEKNINFTITEDSSLNEDHDPIDHDDLVTILGNLIENAFEACVANINEHKMVEVYLKEDDNSIHIEVTDNGVPIPKNIKGKIFERGISSKPNNSGIGLYLVKTKIDLYEGTIELKEFKNSKKFIITLFKEEN